MWGRELSPLLPAPSQIEVTIRGDHVKTLLWAIRWELQTRLERRLGDKLDRRLDRAIARHRENRANS